jgi:hypothetical protein
LRRCRQIRWCNDGAADGVGNHKLLRLHDFIGNAFVQQTAVGRFWRLREGDFLGLWHLIARRQDQPFTTCGRRITQPVRDERHASAVLFLVFEESLHVGDVDVGDGGRDCLGETRSSNSSANTEHLQLTLRLNRCQADRIRRLARCLLRLDHAPTELARKLRRDGGLKIESRAGLHDGSR